jgi:CshA-type fibril repeat protein
VPTGSAIDTATAGEHRFTVGTEDAAGNDAERTVTYTVQAPPSPGDRDSTGVGTEPQRTTVPVPAGATVRLVAADGTAATTVDVTGGRYVLDAATGEITFTPVLGLVGPAPAVRFRVTDDLGQRGDARYTPSVVAPAPAPAPDEETAGASAEVQERTLTVPHGGTITLLDTHDVPTTVVSVAGEGTYALDAATGRVSFVPAAGFHGRATTVRYRVTDAYGQATTGRFTATVRPAPADVPAAPADPSDEPAVPVAPVAPVVPSAPAVPVTGAAPATGTAPAQTAAPASAPVRVTVAIPGRSVATTAVRASCRADGATVRDCAVVLNARVAGRAVVVGHARERGAGRASVEVAVPLTALGRALAARPGGQAIGVVATVRGTDGSTHVARSRTRVVAKTFAVPRPVLFATASAELSRGERHYVDGLAARLRGVKRLRCVGFTDSRDTVPYNRRLGLERAAVVCDRLGRLLGVHATSATRVSRGERGPRASNATARGRRLNRRTEIRVSY